MYIGELVGDQCNCVLCLLADVAGNLTFICNRAWYWLQDVRNASNFATVGTNGNATDHSASDSSGVRPAFLIA